MKVLLAIAMTTALMGTAFGACSTSDLKSCSEADCKKLSAQDGPQYQMEKTTDGNVCRLKETAIATNCTENPNSGRVAGKASDTATGDKVKDGTGAAR